MREGVAFVKDSIEFFTNWCAKQTNNMKGGGNFLV